MRALACTLVACAAVSASSLPARAELDRAGFDALTSAFQDHLDSLGRQDDAPPGMLAAFALPDGRAAFRFNPVSEWTGGGLATNPQDLVRWARELDD